jgi:hypothetical protein
MGFDKEERREVFTAIALHGLLSNEHITKGLTTFEITKMAVKAADKVMEVLNAPPGQ